MIEKIYLYLTALFVAIQAGAIDPSRVENNGIHLSTAEDRIRPFRGQAQAPMRPGETGVATEEVRPPVVMRQSFPRRRGFMGRLGQRLRGFLWRLTQRVPASSRVRIAPTPSTEEGRSGYQPGRPTVCTRSLHVEPPEHSPLPHPQTPRAATDDVRALSLGSPRRGGHQQHGWRSRFRGESFEQHMRPGILSRRVINNVPSQQPSESI